jgi:O-antigen ligase
MSESIRALWQAPARIRVLSIGAAIVLGMAAASLIFFVEPVYLAFLAGGLVFVYLLLFKIDVAIILTLFLQNVLAPFNYLGRGTPFHPNGFMGIALIAGAIWYFLFGKVQVTGFRRVFWFLLFVLLSLITTLSLSGDYFMESLTVTLRLATSLAIFAVLLYKLDSIEKAKWVVIAIAAAQIYPTLVGILLVARPTGLSFTSETFRLGNSGVGITLAMVLTLSLVFFLDARKSSERLLWGSLTALYLVGMFLSFGRSAWISFVIGMMFIGLRRHKWLMIVAPLGLAVALLLVPAIAERFSDISLTNLSAGDNTLAGRIRLWGAAMSLFPSHPLIGVGIGVGRYLVGETLQQYSWAIHNDYVSVLLETGLVGLALFLIWHGQWVFSLLHIYNISKHDYDKTLALAALAVLIVSLVARITDNMIMDAYDMYPLAALAAMVMALPRIRAQMEQPGA